MNRIQAASGSTMGRGIGMRIPRSIFGALQECFFRDKRVEQFAFGLCTQSKTADGTMLLVKDVLLPDKGDLEEQSGGRVCPSRKYQATAYLAAAVGRRAVIDVHTHCMKGVPRLSSIDEAASLKNAEYVCKNMAVPATQGMVVFNQDLTSHDAVIYDRSLQGFRTIDTLDIIGRPTEVRLTGACSAGADVPASYSRHLLVPGWHQHNIARQRIAIVGAGGNGAQLLPLLLCVGAGTDGWIAICDPDVFEASNLSRSPYATGEHIGQPKVTVAALYAGRKSPSTRFFTYPCSVTEKAVQDRLKGATVIFGCGDHDGVRKVCNEVAVRNNIPYIDLGCEIVPGERVAEAVGQVRLVLPGTNACLVCCGGYDPSAAAEELMDDAHAVVHAARGYVRGGREQATPSVAVLNAVAAQTALTAFLGLTLGDAFGKWDFAHFDLFKAKLIAASSTRREGCPLCGDEGVLSTGDPLPEEPPTESAMIEMEAVK